MHRSVDDQLVPRIVDAYGTLDIGSPTADGSAGRPADQPGAASRPSRPPWRAAVEEGGEVLCGGDRVLADEQPDAFYVQPAVVADAGPVRGRAGGDLRPDPVRADLRRRSTRPSRCNNARAAGPLLGDLHQRPGRGRAVHRRPAARTAASSTSTSAPRARRSAARSAARRRPAAVASPARTRGRRTCARPPTRSTTPVSCRSPRASSSSSPSSSESIV